MTEPQANERVEERLDERGGGFGFGRLLVAIALALMIYALSVGPVIRFYTKRSKPVPVPVMVFFAPLELLYNSNPAMRDFYDWYFHMWGVK